MGHTQGCIPRRTRPKSGVREHVKKRSIVSDTTGFGGQLEVASPIELGQFLLLGRKTGALHLVNGDERGALYFLEGDVVAAVAPNMRSGIQGAMELLEWTEGTFHFVPEPVAESDEIDVGTQNLLLETARLMDEAHAGEIVASLREADELSRTFAAITDQSQKGELTVAGEHMTWIASECGRRLFQLSGHPLTGMMPSREVHRFTGASEVDPTSLLGYHVQGPPFAGWFSYRECRLYLSWGRDGYRLIHPYRRPNIAEHLEDASVLEGILGGTEPLLLYGPPSSGKSLLAAMLAVAYADRGQRVVYVTGVPTHDIADGARIVHEIVPPGASAEHVFEVIERWRPEAAIVDLDAPSKVGGLLRDLVISGTHVVATLRTPERQSARESVRLLTGSADQWRFYSPWPVAPGPRLEVSREAA